ncbi:hypothetical protein JCM10908_000362 [Rhodotorula pacifica]|uniref:uncharacterized protein n=1 Tax=Rhodotorula pacifica TaxID=1495444 RepID=UPI0031723158
MTNVATVDPSSFGNDVREGRPPKTTAADLASVVRTTTGEGPPPLVGCSVTLVGEDDVYVFGGRLVSSRTMKNDLWRLHLPTFVWERVWPPIESTEADGPDARHAPEARYFHSACAWGKKLVIFGGETYEAPPTNTSRGTTEGDRAEPVPDAAPTLRTLGDIAIFDATSRCWLDVDTRCAAGVELPAPRYAHLAVVTSATDTGAGAPDAKARMVVVGGQDVNNTYLPSAHVLDLDTMTWIHSAPHHQHVGTYRSVLAASPVSIQLGLREPHTDNTLPSSVSTVLRGYDYCSRPTLAEPEPLLLFSNHNFTSVRRELDLLESPFAPQRPLETTSYGRSMVGPSLPPGLRFPAGAIIGRSLVVFGTHLSPEANIFAIWTLDLGPEGPRGLLNRDPAGVELRWQRIDAGRALASGSWNRAVVRGNTLVVFGHEERDIAADYDQRQSNFRHVAIVDLESFGVYQPPPRQASIPECALALALLGEPSLCDVAVVCSDGTRIAASSRLLRERWPRLFGSEPSSNSAHNDEQATKSDGNTVRTAPSDCSQPSADGTEEVDSQPPKAPARPLVARDHSPAAETISIPAPAHVVRALLLYLYTGQLDFRFQQTPEALSGLLLLALSNDDQQLRDLCVHGLHVLLDTEPKSASIVFETASLARATALQVRALRVMLSK